MTSPATDEWSLLAEAYQDVTVPRFQPMYDTMAKCVIDFIQSNGRVDGPWNILDFGTGKDH